MKTWRTEPGPQPDRTLGMISGRDCRNSCSTSVFDLTDFWNLVKYSYEHLVDRLRRRVEAVIAAGWTDVMLNPMD